MVNMHFSPWRCTYRHRPRVVLWLNQRNQERQAPNQKGVDTLIRLISVLARSPRSMAVVRVPEYMRPRDLQNAYSGARDAIQKPNSRS